MGKFPSVQVQEGLTEFPRACVHSFIQMQLVENVLCFSDTRRRWIAEPEDISAKVDGNVDNLKL